AIKELNYSLGNFKDLLNDTTFIKKDVITLQNPSDIERLNCAKFHHVIHNLKVNYDKVLTKDDDTNNLRLVSPETFGALKELKETYKPPVPIYCLLRLFLCQLRKINCLHLETL
ncbi:hypothetical protein MXB_2729, partial [Myxobolus squamalis]